MSQTITPEEVSAIIDISIEAIDRLNRLLAKFAAQRCMTTDELIEDTRGRNQSLAEKLEAESKE